MFRWHSLWLLFVVAFLLEMPCSWALNAALPIPGAGAKNSTDNPSITKDFQHVEPESKLNKIIRFQHSNLPSLKDDSNIQIMNSSLYKIQTFKPYRPQRKYINMQRSKHPNEIETKSISDNAGSSWLHKFENYLKPKYQPKKKNLHFLYNQKDLAGDLRSKTLRVHVAPGAYPVYNMLAKNNGRFSKYPLKSLSSSQAFIKHLQKNKLQHLNDLDSRERKA